MSEQNIYDNNARLSGLKHLRGKQVKIWDCTLRDGEQAPGVSFNPKEKIKLAKALDAAGVAILDAAMPIVSEYERQALRGMVEADLKAEIGATVRTEEIDINLAKECGVEWVYMFLSTSPIHLYHKFGIQEDQAREKALKYADYAHKKGLKVTYIAEDSARSNPEYLITLFTDLHQAGVERIMICDTVGVFTTSTAIKEFIAEILNNTPKEIVYGIHCHNDFGLAAANTLAAMESGAKFPTVTMNGLGERSGNAPLEQVVMALEKSGVSTGIHLNKLDELSKLVAHSAGIFPSPSQPIVGFNAFRHESGTHAQTVIEDPKTYEPIQPEEVGRKREFVIGKHAGKKQVELLLQDYGIHANKEQLKNITRQLKNRKETREKPRISQMEERLDYYYNHQLGISHNTLLKIASEVIDED